MFRIGGYIVCIDTVLEKVLDLLSSIDQLLILYQNLGSFSTYNVIDLHYTNNDVPISHTFFSMYCINVDAVL